MKVEKALVGCLILEPDSFQDVIGVIDSGYFINRDCQKIFKFMKDAYHEKRGWDNVLISESVPDIHYEKINEMMELPLSVAYLPQYIHRIRLNHYVRQMKEILTQAPDDLCRIEFLMKEYQDSSQNQVARSTEDMFDTALKAALSASEGKVEYPTSFKQLNARTGGFRRGTLTFIGGRPGQNKSNFLLNFVVHFLGIGKKVLMVDFEMTPEEIIHRVVAISQGIPLIYMTHGRNEHMQRLNHQEKEVMRKIIQEVKQDFSEKLFIQKNLKLSDIQREIRSIKPDVVTIDHLQIFAQIMPKEKMDTHALHVSNLCRQLKYIAQTFNIPIIVPSQVTRGSDGDMPTLASLKESGGAEENADLVLNVFTPFVVTHELEDKGRFEVLIAKNRRGQVGKINLSVDMSTGKIRDPKE